MSMTVSGSRISTPASTSAATCCVVRVGHLVERDAAVAGVVDLRADGGLLGRGADRAGDEPRPIGRALVELIASQPGTGDGGRVDLADQLERQVELLHADRAGAERVGLDDVGPGREVAAVDVGDRVRMRQAEDIGEVLEVFVVAGEALAADGGFVEAKGLDLRAHGAVEQQDALGEQRFELVGFVGHGSRSNVRRSEAMCQ